MKLTNPKTLRMSEADWRLFAFESVQHHPSVVRLDVHLSNQHTVHFCVGGKQLVSHQNRPGTKFTESFESDSKNETARRTKFADYYLYLSWNNSNKE